MGIHSCNPTNIYTLKKVLEKLEARKNVYFSHHNFLSNFNYLTFRYNKVVGSRWLIDEWQRRGEHQTVHGGGQAIITDLLLLIKSLSNSSISSAALSTSLFIRPCRHLCPSAHLALCNHLGKAKVGSKNLFVKVVQRPSKVTYEKVGVCLESESFQFVND